MQHPIIFDPTPPAGQLRCPVCGVPIFLSEIEPSDQVGYDQRTFECLTCAYAETATVIPVRRKLTFGGHHVSQ